VTTRYQGKERPAETLEQKECHAEIKGLSHLKLYFKVDSLKGQVFLNTVVLKVQSSEMDLTEIDIGPPLFLLNNTFNQMVHFFFITFLWFLSVSDL
jgi:hypothetical protein